MHLSSFSRREGGAIWHFTLYSYVNSYLMGQSLGWNAPSRQCTFTVFNSAIWTVQICSNLLWHMCCQVPPPLGLMKMSNLLNYFLPIGKQLSSEIPWVCLPPPLPSPPLPSPPLPSPPLPSPGVKDKCIIINNFNNLRAKWTKQNKMFQKSLLLLKDVYFKTSICSHNLYID